MGPALESLHLIVRINGNPASDVKRHDRLGSDERCQYRPRQRNSGLAICEQGVERSIYEPMHRSCRLESGHPQHIVLGQGFNVRAGSVSWMRFALLGKFYDANNALLQAGADLPFDLGTYDWKAYNVSLPLPPERTTTAWPRSGSSLGVGHRLGAEPPDQFDSSCQAMVQEGLPKRYGFFKSLEHSGANGHSETAYASTDHRSSCRRLGKETGSSFVSAPPSSFIDTIFPQKRHEQNRGQDDC